MNAKEALQFLHDRHPHVIDAPDDMPVGPGTLQLEFFWFQGHVCELIDERRDRALKRCFDTMRRLAVDGGPDVKRHVFADFVQPDLIFHAELEWAKEHMPPLLIELCDRARKQIDELYASQPPPDSGP